MKRNCEVEDFLTICGSDVKVKIFDYDSSLITDDPWKEEDRYEKSWMKNEIEFITVTNNIISLWTM